MGNRIYGCDDCLSVCPWNRFARATHEEKLRARDDLTAPRLAELAALDDAGFAVSSPARRSSASAAIASFERAGRDRQFRPPAPPPGRCPPAGRSGSGRRRGGRWALARLSGGHVDGERAGDADASPGAPLLVRGPSSERGAGVGSPGRARRYRRAAQSRSVGAGRQVDVARDPSRPLASALESGRCRRSSRPLTSGQADRRNIHARAAQFANEEVRHDAYQPRRRAAEHHRQPARPLRYPAHARATSRPRPPAIVAQPDRLLRLALSVLNERPAAAEARGEPVLRRLDLDRSVALGEQPGAGLAATSRRLRMIGPPFQTRGRGLKARAVFSLQFEAPVSSILVVNSLGARLLDGVPGAHLGRLGRADPEANARSHRATGSGWSSTTL